MMGPVQQEDVGTALADTKHHDARAKRRLTADLSAVPRGSHLCYEGMRLPWALAGSISKSS
jgi:hypothetical protein